MSSVSAAAAATAAIATAVVPSPSVELFMILLEYNMILFFMFFNGWDGFGSFIRLLDYAVRALSNPTEGRRSRLDG